MTFEAGRKLGPYEIIEQAGAGGMGEVYKATDTRLERTVAIKILPTHVAGLPDFRERFEREAKSISSLNHPHICILYDIGKDENLDYLVMEFIEGETVAERLKKGPMPTDEVVAIGIQIADALEKAHRQNLVHRDLKPANVMLTKNGAKLLDFGLAKIQIDENGHDQATITQSTPLTGAGTIVGTMQYMAPEQLEGKEADSRSDIFSFGILLYEMATGIKAFKGASQASLIASIMKEKPRSASEIQPLVPPMLEQVINQCLAKDPDQRWQSAGDLKRSLKWVSEGGSQIGLPAVKSRKRKTREWTAWGIAVLFFMLAGVSGFFLWEQLSEPKQVLKAHVLAPEGNEFDDFAGGGLSISPDGLNLAFVSLDTLSKKTQLWVRPLNSLAALPLPGTEDAFLPFWSADSRYIAFFADGKLKKILATGGPTLTICDAPSGRDGSWNQDDIILFTPTYNGVIHKVSAAGGESAPITTLDSAKSDKTHRWVKFLPDGNHFLFYARTGSGAGGENDAICLGSLDADSFERIIPARSTVNYANGYILYQREASLMAHPFDVDALELTGDAFPIAENITYLNGWSRSVFTASTNGLILYRSGELNIGSQLLLMDRAGSVLDSLGQQEIQYSQKFSPDEQFIALSIHDAANSNTDIWTYDISRGIKTRFTFDSTSDLSLIWSPDGKQIAFSSDRSGKNGIYIKNVSGLGQIELIYEHDLALWPRSWSLDGKSIFFVREDAKSQADIWVILLSKDSEPYAFISTPFNEYDPTISPDGRWIAYVSDETGVQQVYVTQFPGPGSKWQVSTNEGDRPLWRGDGKELFYLSNEDEIMSAEVDGSGQTFRVGRVEKLFEVNGSRPGTVYDVTSDGQRFLVNQVPQNSAKTTVVMIKNWDVAIENNR